MVNERDGLLVLSPEAGAWAELAGAAIPCQPFDISDTAAAIAAALEMDGDARAERSRRLQVAATHRTPASWFDDQIRAGGLIAAPRRRDSGQTRAARRSTSSAFEATVRSARSTISAGDSGPTTATRRTCTPADARSSSASNAGRSPRSSAA